MVSGPSFYIYGGGRWREVDITDGRVEGWGRARFAYAKRGKVHMAKTRAVLTALRDLKAERKSAVKDGARLPYKKIDTPQKRSERHLDVSECDRSHCLHQSVINRYHPSKTVNPIKSIKVPHSASKIDAAIQTTLPQTLILPDSKQKSSKRHIGSTSSDDNIPSQLTTTALVNPSPNKLGNLKFKKQCLVAGSDKSTAKRVPSLKLNKEDSSKYNIYKRKRTDSSDSLVWVVLPKREDNTKQISNGTERLEKKSKHIKKTRPRTSSKSSSKSQPQKIMRKTKSVKNIDLQQQKDVKKTKSAPNAIKNIDKLTQKSISNSNSNVVLSQLQLDSESLSQTKPGSQDKFKELFIGEDDVEVLRNYLMHNATDFDLLQFDQCDEYKSKFFYSINPLVNVERCQKIARMFHNDSQSEISLKDFASQLGLASVLEKKVPQRYKMRNRDVDRDKDKSDNGTDKENATNITKGGNKKTGSSPKRYTTDTEVDSDFEETKERREDNKRRSLRDRKETNLKNDVKTTYTEMDSDFEKERRGDNKRRSLRNRKDINPKSYVKTINTEIDSDFEEEKERREDNKRRSLRRNPKNDEKTTDTEIDSDFEEEKERREDNKRRSLRRNPKNDEKTTDTEIDSDFEEEKERREDNKRRSLRNRKERNPKNDLKEILSPNKNTAKSDKNSTDEDSSVDEVKARVLRKRKTAIIAEVDLTFKNDSEKLDEQKKISQNNLKKTINKSNIYNLDLTNSTEDSDWISDTEQVKKNINRSRNRKITDTDKSIEEVGSTEEAIKINRNSSKDGNKKTTANKINSDDANGDRSKITKLFIKRNKKGLFLSNSTLKNKHKNSNDNSEAQDKSLKTKKQNIINDENKIKKIIDSYADNSEEQFEPKTRNKNKYNNNTNKSNQISESEDNSEEEFERKSQNELKRRQNKINHIRNNTKHQNKVTATNDETSETDKHKKDTKTDHKQNNIINKNTKETDFNGNKSETNSDLKINNNRNVQNKSNKNFNDSAETLHLNSASETDAFARPIIIGETKSLATMPKDILDRPSSSVSLLRVEYSNLEDHAIVSWISNGGRARCVNGNRIWRELQDQYYSIAGQYRTWHSLRNRYLRSILPRLGQLALDPSLIARLRAAAATGEIKARRDPSRRNSIFDAPVAGALSWRLRAARSPSTEEEPPPKRHKHDHSRKLPPPTSRTLRSSDTSPVKPLHSPRYSEITRHYAAKHRGSTPSSSRSSPEREIPRKKSPKAKKSDRNSVETKKSERNSLATRKSKNLSEIKSPSKSTAGSNLERKISKDSSATEISSPTKLSSATKQSSSGKSLRKSLRVKSPEKVGTKTRKLFNPNFMI